MILSNNSTCTIAEVASSCNAIWFFQLYVFKRRDISAKLAERAERSGYKAIVLTVDAPRLGRREADIKNKMVAPQGKNFDGLISTEMSTGSGSNLEAFANTACDASLSWKDIGWLRSITKLPIFIKGVLTHEDAIKSLELGVDRIVVSNRGACQLDYAPATVSVLEEVVHAVGGKIPVRFIGGIRWGTDIFKALASIGRPVVFGLSKGRTWGKKGCLVNMLKDELVLIMARSGCPSVKDITRNHVSTQRGILQSML
ncbi:hypothetical protein SLE2022_307950 [Rubroshorea leprosula]